MALKDWKLSRYDNLGRIPKPFDESTYIYNSKHFLEYKHSKAGTFVFENVSLKSFAKMHFVKEDQQLISLPNLPFGSIESSELFSEEDFSDVLKMLIDETSGYDIEELIIKHYPPFYRNNSKELEAALEKAGFEILQQDINHHLEINDEALVKRIHSSEKRKIKLAEKSGLVFKEEPNERLEDSYQLIQQFREKRGHSMSISLNELQDFFRIFPDRYKIFTVSKNEEYYALCIGVMVTEHIFYYFLPASNPKYDQQSPMVFLLKSLFEKGQNEQWKYIDLGTSMIGGKINEGLATFKARMGGIQTTKKTYQLHLNE